MPRPPMRLVMFLLREKDGRYAPYGGQTDPSGASIFELETPRFPLESKSDHDKTRATRR